MKVVVALDSFKGSVDSRSAGEAVRRGILAVQGRLRRLMIKKRGRNLHAGQVQVWTEDWFNAHGLHRLRGTIRYPKPA